MDVRRWILRMLCLGLLFCARNLRADLTPVDLSAPFAVQPFAGLMVSSGITESFFADVSGLPFSGPGIVNILANIQAFDSSGFALTVFDITGVTVTQGGSMFTPKLQPFVTASPITYTDSLDPFKEVTVDPSQLNLAFLFNSDPTFQYSYQLSVSGIEDGGFVLYNDVEGAAVPEPGAWLLTASGMFLSMVAAHRRRRTG